MLGLRIFVLATLSGASTQALAVTQQRQPRPEIFTNLINCRSITIDADRLACFDRQVGAMEDAAQRDEVVVLDKSELNKTRKTLFGFSFPKLPFLVEGNDDDKSAVKDGVTQLDAVIASVRSLGYGKWQIKLEDGAQWVTTEPLVAQEPRAGKTIELKRGAMGSFMGKIAGGRAVRMKRIE